MVFERYEVNAYGKRISQLRSHRWAELEKQ